MSGKCAGKTCKPTADGRKRECNPSTGRCKLVEAVERAAAANANLALALAHPSKSFIAQRRGHVVPKNRKAPAGHARNFAGQTAVGLDGRVWTSKLQAKTDAAGQPVYRWVSKK